ncbi:acyltransferase family protein [Saccharomonospora sp. NB11]|jgi:peptidoglycan/LPS O-acetylase OafA/YrhL|uniref:acyltransferase family protein n=1 Tax=Saccharomonospora sp. NB11 TaxID=1642298 RepID=UPI0018D01F90|nr:acyltransferase family protein [Saccharomonospora sp. NB11]
MTTLREPVREESASAPTSRQPRKFRPELQGLRALAAALVVAYHVWLDRISGGVDVFLFVSGFLITGQLYRASVRGRIEYRSFWGRMFKRLLPAALTVLVATMAVSLLWLPEHRWSQMAKEIIASALFYENWQLVSDSADYFAQHSSASLMQHFWSLSIQGQFYLVWPLMIGVLLLIVRWLNWNMRTTLLAVLGLLFAGSLTFSIWLTAVNQPLAYFHSGTRVWQFALGGLLALTIDRIVLPRWLALLAGWLGVVGLATCGVILQVGTMFPGYAALWPMVSAALVLLAGATGSSIGADRFLSSRPLIYLGNISYALYLWHWPVLLFYLIVRGRTEVGLVGGAGVIGLSVVLAMLTYHLIEKPVRESKIGVEKRWGAYRFAVLVLVPVIAAAVVWQDVSVKRARFEYQADDPDHPGAAAVATGAPIYDPEKSVVPPFAALPYEWIGWKRGECSTVTEGGVVGEGGVEVRTCIVKPLNGAEPKKRVVVVGDSHSMQLMGAMRGISERLDWELVVLGKPGCPLTATEELPNNESCVIWNRFILPKIIDLQPDAVVTMATRDVRVGLQEWTPEGYVRQWERLNEAGIPVAAIRDNPRFDFEPAGCAQIQGITSEKCGHPRDEMYHAVPPYETMPVPPNTSFVDLSDYFCTPTHCPPVIGNVLVYMDDNHVSDTFMKTLSPVLQTKLLAALGWEDTASTPQ